MRITQINGPHAGQTVLLRGVPLEDASAALVLVHGRGASAESILTLAPELHADTFAHVAPQAAGSTWYPYSFMAPVSQNEPWLSSALSLLDATLSAVEEAGISREQIVLGGFSQGACLASEYVARNPGRFGGLLVYSGGFIGPLGTEPSVDGSVEGTPVFVGCSDVDFHIPARRVEETAALFRELGGDVTMRLYPGMGHTINQEEIDFGRAILSQVAASA